MAGNVKSLYISRQVLNTDEIIQFFKSQGFGSLTAPEDMHVTQIYSKTPVDWSHIPSIGNKIRITGGDSRRVIPLGDKGAIVLTFSSDILTQRWKQLLENGCKSDYPSYKPHVTLTYQAPAIPLDQVKPWEGQIVLGPERMEEIVEQWRPMEKSEFILDIPLFVKAYSDSDGRRKISFEASNESVDGEGDVILRSALLGSAESFLKGTIDLDHLSEIGARYGVPNPQQYVVGKPLRVFALEGNRTGVEAELFKGNKHADEIWKGLQAEPPQPWRASIYGFPVPDGLVDVRVQKCAETHGATRYLVSKMHWKSTALTLRPVNDAITGTARIIKAATYQSSMTEIIKAYSFSDNAARTPILTQPAMTTADDIYGPSDLPQNKKPDGNTANARKGPGTAPDTIWHAPRNRLELLSHVTHHAAIGKCAHAGGKKSISVATMKSHYMNCAGMEEHAADLHALATLHLLKRH